MGDCGMVDQSVTFREIRTWLARAQARKVLPTPVGPQLGAWGAIRPISPCQLCRGGRVFSRILSSVISSPLSSSG